MQQTLVDCAFCDIPPGTTAYSCVNRLINADIIEVINNEHPRQYTTCEVIVSIEPSLGTRSVWFEHKARCDGEVAFFGSEQRVWANRSSEGSRKIPDDLWAAIAEYTGDPD